MLNTIEEVGSKADTSILEVAFGEVPNIAAFLNSIRNVDDRTLMLRLGELNAMKMTTASWNTMGIAARVALFNHPAYSQVIGIVQEKGGI